jgi:hypothetical protein
MSAFSPPCLISLPALLFTRHLATNVEQSRRLISVCVSFMSQTLIPYFLRVPFACRELVQAAALYLA